VQHAQFRTPANPLPLFYYLVCCSHPSPFFSIDEHIYSMLKKQRLTIDGKPFVPVDVFWKLDNRLEVALDDRVVAVGWAEEQWTHC
jgi:hypothetical protein